MKKIFSILSALIVSTTFLTSCIEEVDPQNGLLTEKMYSETPGAFESQVSALTASLNGKMLYGSFDIVYAIDFGTTSLWLERDAMGMDMVPGQGNNFTEWYSCTVALGEQYALCQIPWTSYYGLIKDCNTAIGMYKAAPSKEKAPLAGVAYVMRAMHYQDIVRMYAAAPYHVDPNAETVPYVDDESGVLEKNPRATFSEAYGKILDDLDEAEKLLEGYERPDIYTPDISVVYGLKARAYLEIEDWENAEKYAKLAQEGYAMMSEDEYLSRDNGFNSPNSSWMFATRFRDTDECIKDNDGDASWGSIMCMENGFDCGYGANYGGPVFIDRHLYETIPASDFRKQMFVDFNLDEMDAEAQAEALTAYTYYPEQIQGAAAAAKSGVGGMEFKFRPQAGMYAVKYTAWCISIPLMRIEEMKLIEAEAAGMQDEGRGIQLLTAFAQTRDPQFVYGSHNEAYGNPNSTPFQNEIWWQRRVELWGEGFATFDIKRLNKGIIRNYPNTNHIDMYRWNFENQNEAKGLYYPDWMNYVIVGTETETNSACTNNPDPVAPIGNSPAVTTF